jgi:hypothetical protein
VDLKRQPRWNHRASESPVKQNESKFAAANNTAGRHRRSDPNGVVGSDVPPRDVHEMFAHLYAL